MSRRDLLVVVRSILLSISIVNSEISRIFLNLKIYISFRISTLTMKLSMIDHLWSFWSWNFSLGTSLSAIFGDIIVTTELSRISIWSRGSNVIGILCCWSLRMLTMLWRIWIIVLTLVITRTIQRFLFDDHPSSSITSIVLLPDDSRIDLASSSRVDSVLLYHIVKYSSVLSLDDSSMLPTSRNTCWKLLIMHHTT